MLALLGAGAALAVVLCLISSAIAKAARVTSPPPATKQCPQCHPDGWAVCKDGRRWPNECTAACHGVYGASSCPDVSRWCTKEAAQKWCGPGIQGVLTANGCQLSKMGFRDARQCDD